MGYNKVKHLLDIYKWGCGPFCVPLLTARILKPLRWDDFVYQLTFTNKGRLLRLRMTRDIKCHTQKLVHDILRYVSKFRSYEPNK